MYLPFAKRNRIMKLKRGRETERACERNKQRERVDSRAVKRTLWKGARPATRG